MNVNEELIINLTKSLLKSIDTQDWETYESLCDENLSCVEPESSNKIVFGLDFHKFFFEKTELSSKTTFKSSQNARRVCYKLFLSFVQSTQEQLL